MMLLAPVAPYIAEELWITTGHEFSVHQQSWPTYNKELARVETVMIPVQVNGKTRGNIQAVNHTTKAAALKTALETPLIRKYLVDLEITRVVYVPGKILNVVTK